MLIILMLITTPSRERFDDWVLLEYQIHCDYDSYMGNVCYKDGIKVISRSAHFRNAALFASYEKHFKYDNGDNETFRTLGILGMFFKMKSGSLWDVLN